MEIHALTFNMFTMVKIVKMYVRSTSIFFTNKRHATEKRRVDN